MLVPHVFSMVLAGGRGRRLEPLTRDRAKSAVPFGGQYRVVDFALSNLVNGGYLRIAVLTQYKSQSLNRHLAQTWRTSPLLGNYVAAVPPQMRRGAHFFSGSADAVYQNFNLIREEDPDYVVVFGTDHIYRMDPRQMVNAHIDSGAGMTVAGTRVPARKPATYGIVLAGRDGRITRFVEPGSTNHVPSRRSRPVRSGTDDAGAQPDRSERVYASMGNYVFTTGTLLEVVAADAHDTHSSHDLGRDVIPRLAASQDARVYDFADNEVPGSTERDRDYWRHIGTLDAFHDAHMDMVAVDPDLNLYNREWPIYSWNPPAPPAKFVFDDDGRRGAAYDSMIGQGVILAGGTVRRSVLSPGTRVRSYSTVEESVLMHGVRVGRHAVVRHAIVDKNVDIPEGARIGVDLDRDRGRFTVTDNGVVVIGKGDKVDP